MIAVPTAVPFDENGQPSRPWIEWAQKVSRDSNFAGSDTTANRPTDGLNDGDQYLDTTLGYIITYYNGGWIDSVGTSV